MPRGKAVKFLSPVEAKKKLEATKKARFAELVAKINPILTDWSPGEEIRLIKNDFFKGAEEQTWITGELQKIGWSVNDVNTGIEVSSPVVPDEKSKGKAGAKAGTRKPAARRAGRDPAQQPTAAAAGT